MNPMGGSTLYTYDLNRNLESVTDYNGKTTHYRYNSANQLTRKYLLDGEVVIFFYNSLIWIKTATDNDTDLEFAYDDIGRLTV